jgi:hypothetical protein
VTGGFDAANKLGDNAIAIDYLIQAEEEAMDVEMSSPIFIPSHEALEGLYFFTTNLSAQYYAIQEKFEKQQEKELREKQRKAAEERWKRSPSKKSSVRSYPQSPVCATKGAAEPIEGAVAVAGESDSSALGTPMSFSLSSSAQLEAVSGEERGASVRAEGASDDTVALSVPEPVMVLVDDESKAVDNKTAGDLAAAIPVPLSSGEPIEAADVVPQPDVALMMQSLSSDDDDDSDPAFALKFSDSMLKRETANAPMASQHVQAAQRLTGDGQGVPEKEKETERVGDRMHILDDYTDSLAIARTQRLRLDASYGVNSNVDVGSASKTSSNSKSEQATTTATTATTTSTPLKETAEKGVEKREVPVVDAKKNQPMSEKKPENEKSPEKKEKVEREKKPASEYVSKLFITMRSPQFILLQSFSSLPGDFTPSFVFNLGDCNMTRIDTYSQTAVEESEEDGEDFDEALREDEFAESGGFDATELLARRQRSQSIRRATSSDFARHSSLGHTRYQASKKEKVVKTLVHDQLHIHLEETSIYRALFNGFTLSHEVSFSFSFFSLSSFTFDFF